jgi:hypothetical protein
MRMAHFSQRPQSFDEYVQCCACSVQEFKAHNCSWFRFHYVYENDRYVANNKGDTYHIKSGRRIGLVLAYIDKDGHAYVGYSLCHPRDTFNREVGLYRAFLRAIRINSISIGNLDFPPEVEQTLIVLVDVVLNREFV